MEQIIPTYQITMEILEPTTGTALYIYNEPAVSRFRIRREFCDDIVHFKSVIRDEDEVTMTPKTMLDHPLSRSWYNHTNFMHGKNNEIIHIDINDAKYEDKYSCVNCHILITNNDTGEVFYEFGKWKK